MRPPLVGVMAGLSPYGVCTGFEFKPVDAGFYNEVSFTGCSIPNGKGAST